MLLQFRMEVDKVFYWNNTTGQYWVRRHQLYLHFCKAKIVTRTRLAAKMASGAGFSLSMSKFCQQRRLFNTIGYANHIAFWYPRAKIKTALKAALYKPDTGTSIIKARLYFNISTLEYTSTVWNANVVTTRKQRIGSTFSSIRKRELNINYYNLYLPNVANVFSLLFVLKTL